MITTPIQLLKKRKQEIYNQYIFAKNDEKMRHARKISEVDEAELIKPILDKYQEAINILTAIEEMQI